MSNSAVLDELSDVERSTFYSVVRRLTENSTDAFLDIPVMDQEQDAISLFLVKRSKPYIVLDDSTPYKRELLRKFKDDENYEELEGFQTSIMIRE
jgi:hypothetical protein